MRAFLLLLFMSLSAHAQTAPKQWPIYGKTENFITGKHGTDDDGHRWAAWRYLSDDGFRWVSFVAVIRRDKVLNLTAPLAGENPGAYLTRMWSANAPLPCTDSAISSICDTALAAIRAVPSPEPPAFVVAKNGTALTRPMYAYEPFTKVLGAQIAKRATVGAECACWAEGMRKGTTAYCIVVDPAGSTRADEVAICSPK